MTKPKPKAPKPDDIEIVDLTGGALDKLPKEVSQGLINLLRRQLSDGLPRHIHLGETVVIKATGQHGRVRAIYLSMDRKGPSFHVYYSDRNGLSTDRYFERDEIDTLDAKPQPKAKKATTPKKGTK